MLAKESRTCKQCNGTGLKRNILGDSRKKITCEYCGGTGYIPAPNIEEIIDAVTTSRGASKGKRKFRQSPPNRFTDRWDYKNARAYYVWRMARFHGGVDVTMPVIAEMVIHYDPYQKELDNIAAAIARAVFGTDLAAAARWGTILGAVNPNELPDNLPASAYFNGPVVMDGYKPEFEIAELL